MAQKVSLFCLSTGTGTKNKKWMQCLICGRCVTECKEHGSSWAYKYLGMFSHQSPPRTTPSPPESLLRRRTDAHRCRRSATDQQRHQLHAHHKSKTIANLFVCECLSLTLIPVLVASCTASSSLSYFGLNVTVKAQSMIRPARRDRNRGERL